MTHGQYVLVITLMRRFLLLIWGQVELPDVQLLYLPEQAFSFSR